MPVPPALDLKDRKRYDVIMVEKVARLREGINWFPFPAIIGGVLTVVLVANVFIQLNPKVGNPADLLMFESSPLPTKKGIWISVVEDQGQILVRTYDNQVLRLDPNEIDPEASPLVEYFRQHAEDMALDAGLAKSKNAAKFSVLISADQSLKYGSIVPVLESIAAAGISDYAFETQMPASME